MRLFHYSEEAEIERFEPRAPVRHPESKPYVYAISEAFAPLYYFPRDCPRIGVCRAGGPYRLIVQSDSFLSLREARIWEYEFDLAGFVDCKDHGVFVSSEIQVPIRCREMSELTTRIAERLIPLEVVDSLVRAAGEFFDFETQTFIASDHVSMIRMSLLPDWPLAVGSSVVPKRP